MAATAITESRRVLNNKRNSSGGSNSNNNNNKNNKNKENAEIKKEGICRESLPLECFLVLLP